MTVTLPPSSGRRSLGDDPETDRRVERRVGLPSGRAVIGGLLMALAATGTFLAYAGANQDDRIEVLVASRDLRPGDLVAATDVRIVDVDLPPGIRGLFGTVDAAVGRQILAPVDRGEFLSASSTTEAAIGAETLEVTLSLAGSRVGGRLAAGERVDVFSTWSESVTELIAVDARILEIDGGGTDSLSGNDQVLVRLAVADFAQIEALVHAQAAGDITMVHAAIGSHTGDVGREYRPLTGPAPTTTMAPTTTTTTTVTTIAGDS